MPRSTDSGKLALWQERFERFWRGQMGVGPFCARERVSVASFYCWREKVGERGRRGEGRPQTDRRSVFQPVTVVPLDTAQLHSRSVAAQPCVASRVPAASAVRIELPGGTRIEVGSEDLEVVRAVVGIVRNTIRAYRDDLRRLKRIDVRSCGQLGCAAEFDVANLVRHEEGVREIISGILMENEQRIWVINSSCAVQTNVALGYFLHRKGTSDCFRASEVIRLPWIVPRADSFVMQSLSSLTAYLD